VKNDDLLYLDWSIAVLDKSLSNEIGDGRCLGFWFGLPFLGRKGIVGSRWAITNVSRISHGAKHRFLCGKVGDTSQKS
jgi:hypothetical protein